MRSGSPISARPPWQKVITGLFVLTIIIITPIGLSCPQHPAPVHVRILAVNDFHGQLPGTKSLNGEAAGGAPVLASYLSSAAGQATTFIALPGDIVGASPPESGLLLDEPTLLFWSSLADDCPTIATFGNHEFDRGIDELLRTIDGGNGTTTITHLVDPYPGTKMEYISANVVWEVNNTPITAPYTIRDADGVQIAFIGAVTTETPSIQRPANVEGIIFRDEVESINRYIPEIQERGVHAIVILLHEGGSQEAYEGLTRSGCNVTGRVTGIVAGLDPDVDVVLSAHTHEFTNAYLENAGGNPVLVTQAYNCGRAYADIDLIIDPLTGDITHKVAEIVPAYASGTGPDPEATALLEAAREMVRPITDRIITSTPSDITDLANDAGESLLGNLVVDGQRAAMQADVAFITTGSLRADIPAGDVTWGDLYAVQPFSSNVLSMTLTGEQIRDVLEQQWQAPLPPHNLAVSGLSYTFDDTRPAGDRVTEIRVTGTPIEPEADYTVAMVDFLATGGDGYTVFMEGRDLVYGPLDVDALVTHMTSLTWPAGTGTRITRAA
ncbi:MAG: bifunctional metallophosphatase/5'-nucleotidase [Methanomicrobiales archaeon]|nr:bifunctional metallophosphatase/5'-nucleotidase [Methanomicrobiales archaeon]